jgi:hypothetical protein
MGKLKRSNYPCSRRGPIILKSKKTVFEDDCQRVTAEKNIAYK